MELYEILELVIAPYHSLFVIYQPGIGDFVILPDSKFQEPLCEGLGLCFHLDFLVRGSPIV